MVAVAPPRPDHPTPEERRSVGRAARKVAPRRSHATWSVDAPGRADPVGVLEAQDADRLPWLVPVRHARMMASPFAFYRGAAAVMAADLATTPTSGLAVQLCGDAHLANFGSYASPERNLVFDCNDFDETIPGPWEYDLKRLATSFTIAAQHLGFDATTARAVTVEAARSYRAAMAELAGKGLLELWYQRLDVTAVEEMAAWGGDRSRRNLERFEARARSRDNLQALRKLAVEVDGAYRIRSDPPLLVPLRELEGVIGSEHLEEAALAGVRDFRESLSDDRRALLDRFRPVDIALKVVGVGSVGTRCLVVLLEGRDREDPLFLQVKEAGPSVLEPVVGASPYPHQGQRVVEGQRLLQAVSDIFLGWTAGPAGRHFYVRQLRDWKGSVELESASPAMVERYATVCGWTLARGHARSGDPVAIAAYLGSGTAFDEAITEFAEAYAAQNGADYEAFLAAIDSGRLAVSHEA